MNAKSQYFPLAAVAGCNDIRISIKFRPLKELLQIGGKIGTRAAGLNDISEITLPEAKDIALDEKRTELRLVSLASDANDCVDWRVKRVSPPCRSLSWR